ncbi:phospholipid:diacylglycerol acyltransferase [Nematocida major]|uniref:phospholipid:diacylglycerol acyltransferase n=1 Tax=Nematocida major TaxID=1912982 RepID=UPI002008243D|nr:phospholipid:diacylglycerol acyltransferase [Nematocida major]KAH9385678.1 phospholipid:diacylglycerol acyltransferase [Nematocida major]
MSRTGENRKKEKHQKPPGTPAEESPVYVNNACIACGQARPKRKKRYFLFAVIGVVIGYFVKTGYEKAFKKHVIMNLMEELLNSKTVMSMNLSETTKAKLLYLADIAAFSPYEELDQKPGMKGQAAGLVGKHPITIIPGIANTSLELWKTKKENNSFFRKKIWGSHSTITFMLHNRSEWLESMKLNTETGLDPIGIKVRACAGLESSDFSIPGMWFWWKIVENLSHIGYDPADVHFAAFDWRLGLEEMEIRDGYFTKLKIEIELQSSMKQEKTVIIAHSLGAVIFHYFMQWVSEKDEKWVDKHIHAAAYIGPPLLGAPKAIGSVLAGEVKYTSDMGIIQYTIVELLFGREKRQDLFKTWGSPIYLLPKGGEKFWSRGKKQLHDLVAIEESPPQKSPRKKYRFTTQAEIFDMIREMLPQHNKKIHEKLFHPKTQRDGWSNPLLSPLPNAPSMTVYSLYGMGIPTESGYYFAPESGSLQIDKNNTVPEDDIYKGIVHADGDGTVPVISMGYMGAAGWKKDALNPHKVRTVVREYRHVASSSLLDIRGGEHTAQHVNILGNTSLIEDILEIVSGKALPDKVASNLKSLAAEIDRDENSPEDAVSPVRE